MSPRAFNFTFYFHVVKARTHCRGVAFCCGHDAKQNVACPALQYICICFYTTQRTHSKACITYGLYIKKNICLAHLSRLPLIFLSESFLSRQHKFHIFFLVKHFEFCCRLFTVIVFPYLYEEEILHI